MNRKFLFSSALTLAAIVSFATVGDSANVTWKPKVGNEIHYKFVSEIPDLGGQGDMKLGADVDHKITEIRPDGNVVVVDKQSDFSVTLNGTDMTQAAAGQIPQSVTETTIEKPNGQIVERKTDAPAQMAQPRMDALSEFVFPDHSVNVGDTWSKNLTGDKAKGTFDSQTTYTYQGKEAVGGTDSYKIAFEYKETNAPSNITASGTFWVSADDGELVKATMKVKNAQLGPLPSVDMTTDINRA